MSNNRPQKTYKSFQGFGDEPKFEDFGITALEYDKFAKGHNPWNIPLQLIAFVIAVISSLVIYFTLDNSLDVFIYGFFIYMGLGTFMGFTSEWLTKRNPLYRKSKSYKEALENYYQTKVRYWMSLKGLGLEYIIGDLYRKLGYKIEHTSRTGDEGVDLILKKDNIATIVQCKGYKNQVGPSVVRELYGTLKSCGVGNAILVCPAGFTRGAKATAVGKNIQLISSHELIAMVKELE